MARWPASDTAKRENRKVQMPQDGDGSGLIYLIWAAWIYWIVYSRLDRLSSLEQTEKERKRHDPLGASHNARAISPSTATAITPTLEMLVTEILRRDGAAEVGHFLSQRLAAYEATVAAFNAGDRETLRELLSSEVYDVFSDAIAAREARQQNIKTVFSQIDTPVIVDGLIDETHMEIAVRFVSESFELSCQDRPPDRRQNVDIWTFGRVRSSHDGAWRVTATGAGA
jgi:predicted lipid-binding transport protein (Tim44 family)